MRSQAERPSRISSAIATAGTVLKFDCESSRRASRRLSQYREKSLAESIHRATHRLDSKGVSEPLHHPERSPSQENVIFIFPLLPRIKNSLEPRQACPFPREGLSVGKIVAILQLGGLHHRYERIAA